MKLIVSSDRENLINAEFVGHFYVLRTASEEGYSLFADGDFISKYASRDIAVKKLNDLAVALSQDRGPILYQMEDVF